jgi:hypothetical protein
MILIEKTVMDYLDTVLDDPSFTQEQNNGMTRFHLIQKVGSSTENKIFTSMVAVQSIAPSRIEAAQMNKDVCEAMENIVELEVIGSCKLNSDYDYTDTSKKRYRYQALFEIVHY